MQDIEATEKLGFDELQQICRDRLRETLRKAGQDVPYYRKLFSQKGLDPAAADIERELRKLPLLNKAAVREMPDSEITSERYGPEQLTPDYTGGTTGAEPMRILLDKAITHQREQAFLFHMYRRAGVEFGKPFVQIKIDSPRGWKYHEPLANKLLLSQSLMDETTLDRYIEAIEKFRPKYMNALASTAYRFVQLLEQEKRTLNVKLQAVLLGSEMIYDYQRKAIEETLNTRVFSWYGHVERLILAGEGREDKDVYYVFPQYGYTEIVDDDGNPITEPNRVGQIVGTGFNNDGMPLIRYATGDYGAWADRKYHDELPYPAIHSIEGREQEFVIAADGRSFSLVPILFQMHNEFWASLEDVQFTQPAPGQLVANVVPAKDKHGQYVTRLVHESLRPNINPAIEFSVALITREDIVTSTRGKKRLLLRDF
jgi:phenylacetate-CoA ligase